MTEPLELVLSVACSPEHAFDTWAVRTSLWWPDQHSFSGEPGIDVRFEPFPGGRVYERTPVGAEHDWGVVLHWDPPHRLAYVWHLAADRADATEVEITFTGTGERTTVRVVHRGWNKLGSRGPAWRERNLAGWEGVLPSYRMFLENEGVWSGPANPGPHESKEDRDGNRQWYPRGSVGAHDPSGTVGIPDAPRH